MHTCSLTHSHARTHTCTHTYHLLSCLLSVHETLGDDTRCQNLIPLAELLEQNAVRETETADSDSLQHSIATQLVQHEMGGNLSRLFLVVGDDATDKVRLSGAECGHQIVQLFLRKGGRERGGRERGGREGGRKRCSHTCRCIHLYTLCFTLHSKEIETHIIYMYMCRVYRTNEHSPPCTVVRLS